jgi:hypothetical protein
MDQSFGCGVATLVDYRDDRVFQILALLCNNTVTTCTLQLSFVAETHMLKVHYTSL